MPIDPERACINCQHCRTNDFIPTCHRHVNPALIESDERLVCEDERTSTHPYACQEVGRYFVRFQPNKPSARHRHAGRH